MSITSHMARRVTAATAAAAAAILIPAVALAAPGRTAGHAAPAAAPRCASGQLVAWLGIPAGAAAGSLGYQLEVSNISRSTCTLYGYPGVSAFGPHGGQLGSAAARDHAHAPRLVTLARGATAHMELYLADAANYPPRTCQPRQAAGLRVYPPGAYRSLTIPYSFRACGAKGPRYLHVTTTLGGTGVPLYSH
ncbi:MAG TPA: DUF4232 domain-containing protein [Streptosporangiaceae bacterium]|jgi:hypothetical protein